MSKFGSLQDAFKHFEENGGNSNNKFFTLKNDRDTAIVRFLHEGEEDLDWYIVHSVEIEGKKRHVKCSEESDCPLCKSGNKPQLKLFLQLVQKGDEEGVIRTWERGQKFIPKVLSFINRYGNLCSQPIEIERLGKKGDQKTDYQLYALDKDDKTLAELPKRQALLGENAFILEKSKEDMQKIADGSYKYEKVQQPTPRQTEQKTNSDLF
jgi:hypothetical protein